MFTALKIMTCLTVSVFLLACSSYPTEHHVKSGLSKPGAEQASRSSHSTWKHLGNSVTRALSDPHSWAPLLGAAAFSVDDYDQELVDWADKHHPLFQDRDTAQKRSDDLRSLSKVNYALSLIATPTDTGAQSIGRKARNGVLGAFAMSSNAVITRSLKSEIHRRRPFDSPSSDSFPSGHTSSSATAAGLSAKNISRIDLSPTQELLWTGSSYTIAALTGWARIEAGVHYPSDVLAGYALGNFIAVFFNELIIYPQNRDDMVFSVDRQLSGDLALSFRYSW